MTIEELIAEGEALARPSLLLVDEPNENGVVAFWGGAGRVELPAGYEFYTRDARHWITFDCAWLARYGRCQAGHIVVYEQQSGGEPQGNTFYFPTSLRDVEVDGAPLYGVEAPSFPPFQAVCLYGSERVKFWLTSLGLERHDYETATGDLLRQYEQEWLRRTPWLSGKYAGVLGGWHLQWPDDDFYLPLEAKLLLWTFRDSEPWVEVWGPRMRTRFCIT